MIGTYNIYYIIFFKISYPLNNEVSVYNSADIILTKIQHNAYPIMLIKTFFVKGDAIITGKLIRNVILEYDHLNIFFFFIANSSWL